MNKYLIFRTDRIGDFLVSAILLKCIKKNDPNGHIIVVASSKNYKYIKTFPYVNDVIQLNNNFISKFIVFLKLSRFKFISIIIHDDKKRSKFISFFLKSANKIKVLNTRKITHIELIKDILQKMSFDFFNESLNTLVHREQKKIKDKNLIQLHFDEKWIYNDYIQKFINIEPTEIELVNFIKEIKKKNIGSLLITTGLNLPDKIKQIKPTLNDLKINLYEGLNFLELEKITSRSNILISCHGAISHVASANNIKQIDIIDKSYNYGKWTNHFRNYTFLYRDNFAKLSDKILNLI